MGRLSQLLWLRESSEICTSYSSPVMVLAKAITANDDIMFKKEGKPFKCNGPIGGPKFKNGSKSLGQ